MVKVRGIIIDFIDKSQYYYKAGSAEESRALHKVYELLKGCRDRDPNVAITSIAIAAGCNNDDECHIHAGKTGVLLETMAGMTATLLSHTDEPKVIECLFVDAMHDALLEELKKLGAKEEPSQMRGR